MIRLRSIYPMDPDDLDESSGLLKKTAIGFVVISSLLFLVWVVENWRGRLAWEKYQRQKLTQGQPLKWNPSTNVIPIEQNFAEAPVIQALASKNSGDPTVAENLFQPLASRLPEFNYDPWIDGEQFDLEKAMEKQRAKSGIAGTAGANAAEEILSIYGQVEPIMEEIREAARRPFSQFPLPAENPFTGPMPHFVNLRKLSQCFSLHAVASLAAGQTNQAFADVRVLQQLARGLEGHPTLVSAMIRTALMRVALASFWEGWAAHRWSEAQLREFQETFANTRMLEQVVYSLDVGERGGVNQLMDDARKGKKGPAFLNTRAYSLLPSGWVYQNQLKYNQVMDQAVSAYQPASNRFSPKGADAFQTQYAAGGRRGPFHLLASMSLPNISKALQNTTQTEALVREAELACALERHRLARGDYPESLDALVPAYLKQLPVDPILNEPLKYRRLPGKSGFLLYSIGWDEADDQGQMNRQNRLFGDWVWPMPAAAEGAQSK